MKIVSPRVCVLLCIMLCAAVTLPAWAADEKAKADNKKPSQPPPPPQEEEDIWQEVSFGPEKDLKLTEKQIDKVLQDIKESDPKKAETLNKLKETDPKAFNEAIQDEIHKQVEAAKQPQPEPDQRWKERIEQQHKEFLSWYKKQYPKEHKELIQLQKSDPEKFAKEMLDRMHIYGQIQWMQKRNPELAAAMKKNLELQKRRDALLLQIRISPEEEQATLVEELKTVVSERFDTIVKEKQLQFQWLGKRLEQLTKRLQERAAELETLEKTKDQSVETRMKELIERTENVNWN